MRTGGASERVAIPNRGSGRPSVLSPCKRRQGGRHAQPIQDSAAPHIDVDGLWPSPFKHDLSASHDDRVWCDLLRRAIVAAWRRHELHPADRRIVECSHQLPTAVHLTLQVKLRRNRGGSGQGRLIASRVAGRRRRQGYGRSIQQETASEGLCTLGVIADPRVRLLAKQALLQHRAILSLTHDSGGDSGGSTQTCKLYKPNCSGRGSDGLTSIPAHTGLTSSAKTPASAIELHSILSLKRRMQCSSNGLVTAQTAVSAAALPADEAAHFRRGA